MRQLVVVALAAGLALPGHAAAPPPSTASAQTHVTPISITQIGKNTFMVRDPLTMTFKDGAPPITVPAGFVTELASVPKRLQWWKGDSAASIVPAVFHDYLYWTRSCTQDEADAVMYHAMTALGGGTSKDAAIYRAVSGTGSAALKSSRASPRQDEVRTFTPEYVTFVVQSPFDPNETLASALRKAQSSSGLVKQDSPGAAVRLSCARLLHQCKACRDQVAKKKR
jgi:Protein of unknown function (DUF1353)